MAVLWVEDSGNYPDGVNQQVFDEAHNEMDDPNDGPDESWGDCPYCNGGAGHHDDECEYLR